MLHVALLWYVRPMLVISEVPVMSYLAGIGVVGESFED
jgi:hypothetical protein